MRIANAADYSTLLAARLSVAVAAHSAIVPHFQLIASLASDIFQETIGKCSYFSLRYVQKNMEALQ